MNEAAKVLAIGATAMGCRAAEAGGRYKCVMGRVNANDDAAISRQEMAELRQSRFRRLDTDNAGRVMTTEIEPAVGARRADRVAKRFEMLDTNRDGAIDRAEIAAWTDRRFSRMDRDGDGLVTGKELRAMRGRNRWGG